MIQKGDFIELHYLGKLKESGAVFDVTDVAAAKAAGVYRAEETHAPIIICIGERFVVPGLDEFLVGKDLGKYTVTLTPEHAFGMKRPELIQLVPAQMFLKKGIQPVLGLRLDFDGAFGEIKSISGGRVLVDFNHPLAGRDVVYELTVVKKVTDVETQVDAVMKFLFGKTPYTFKDGVITIGVKLRDEKQAEAHIKKILPSVKQVLFEQQSGKNTQPVASPHEKNPVKKTKQ